MVADAMLLRVLVMLLRREDGRELVGRLSTGLEHGAIYGISVYLGVIPLKWDIQEKEEKGEEIKDKIFLLYISD